MSRRMFGRDVLMATRPKGFFDDWVVFCKHALAVRLSDDEEQNSLATVLLAAGAVLGGATMIALVASNKEAVDAQGQRWGINNLGTIAGASGAVAGAAGGAWLARTLGRHSDPAEVDGLQEQLSTTRRSFESLRGDREAGRLSSAKHRQAVERLFEQLVSR